jgi:streptogramin lyase
MRKLSNDALAPAFALVCVAVALATGAVVRADIIYYCDDESGLGAVHALDPATGNVKTLIDGTGSGLAANHIDYPIALTLDKNGNVYVGNANNGDVVKVTPAGVASDHFAVPDPTHFPHVYGLAFDATGNLYTALLAQNEVGKIPSGGGSQTVFATGLDRPAEVYVDPWGNLYVFTHETLSGSTVVKIAPDGTSATIGTGICGVRWDSAGDM